MLKILFLMILVPVVSDNKILCGLAKIRTTHELKKDPIFSDRGQWPWTVALMLKINTTIYHNFPVYFFCTSTLINERTLVTAAHCVSGNVTINKMNHTVTPRKIRAMIGVYELQQNFPTDNINFQIEDKKMPEEYPSPRKSEADIALLFMKVNVTFNQFTQPICMPYSYDIVEKKEGVVVGFGKMSDVLGENMHQKIAKNFNVTIDPLLICYNSSTNSGYVLSERSFCAKGNSSVICEGDSGGGLYISSLLTKHFKIVGVTSGSFDNECTVSKPIAFVNVPKFVDWIESHAEGEIFFHTTFTCDNNEEIISFQLKCDGKANCKDGSDEKYCLKGQITGSTNFTVGKSEIAFNDSTSIHHQRNTNITYFISHDNRKIKHLPKWMGEIFPNLLYYQVTFCGINTLKDNFIGLTKLKTLKLYENFIDKIDAEAFDSLVSLESISLSNNYLKKLESKIFQNAINLKEIDFTDNEIKSIPDSTFKPLMNLQIIKLSYNFIENISFKLFRKNIKLEKLLLRDNKIQFIHQNAFNSSKKLIELDLSKNKCINEKFVLNDDAFIDNIYQKIKDKCNRSRK